jgi:thiamine-phosphate pyrophosphorylase
VSKPAPPFPPGLYAICDDQVAPGRPLVNTARALLAGGVRALQLRIKVTPERVALAAAREVARLCREAGAVCLVNDRVDWALVAGADGAHVGDTDLPARDARAVLGPGRVLGVTVRSAAAARLAADAGADYVGAGPVFSSRTKEVPAELLGVAGLAALVKGSPLPVVAISGIGLSNIGEVAASGAHGAAVLSDLLLAEDVPGRARALAAAFALALRR